MVKEIAIRIKEIVLLRSKPTSRQIRMLEWLQGFIIVLLILTLILVFTTSYENVDRGNNYEGLIIFLILIMSFNYRFNQKGKYYLSALSTIAITILASWFPLIFDPNVIQGDVVPLTYVTISILLSSLLLPPAITIAVAAFQWLGLVFVSIYVSSMASVNWASFLVYIFMSSVLGILANIIQQRDMAHIDYQSEQLKLREFELQERSVRDHLTGLYNRRYLDETLIREIKQAESQRSSIGIIMLDIDHFKQFNDELGHSAGDTVLMALGDHLSKCVREYDIACRYGGEEFVLVLPRTELEVTKKRAEYVRQTTSNLEVKYNAKRLKPITISLGVAAYPHHGMNSGEILRSVDSALLAAKEYGRNRVEVAQKT
ncbi:GGDEF domain-containing protein [Candidatus Chloroploca sp. Khr17]|uniref:GGDEF domain-containing protein n=1 Tax=Candidatus Chloroploca sp. Khr17 TaxID=2496869 RepID=UPI00101CF3E4|nr:GGDEF domain-containing protein [Candidatus Chloroploca sp. Khr17]